MATRSLQAAERISSTGAEVSSHIRSGYDQRAVLQGEKSQSRRKGVVYSAAHRVETRRASGRVLQDATLWCGEKASLRNIGLLSRGRRHIALSPACSKMFVPGFGEKSPEAKAADSLHNFFTYLAVKIVLAQLQAYNPDGYKDLKEFVDRVPLKDGDRFCAELMRESPQHKRLAMRILEVRSAYAREDFEWDNLKALSQKVMDDANTTLMRDFLVETSKWD